MRRPLPRPSNGIEVVDGQLVIITELADMSLKDRFKACLAGGHQGIPRDELLVYLGDAADALDYMNEHYSLQHLDVKPENLLIVGGRVKVADFGLVKELHGYTLAKWRSAGLTYMVMTDLPARELSTLMSTGTW